MPSEAELISSEFIILDKAFRSAHNDFPDLESFRDQVTILLPGKCGHLLLRAGEAGLIAVDRPSYPENVADPENVANEIVAKETGFQPTQIRLMRHYTTWLAYIRRFGNQFRADWEDYLGRGLKGLIAEANGSPIQPVLVPTKAKIFTKRRIANSQYSVVHISALAEINADACRLLAEEIRPVEYTPFMSPSEWLKILKHKGESISRETFRLMRKGEHAITLRQHPESTTKNVALVASDAAKLGYSASPT